MFCNIIYEFYKHNGLDLTENEVDEYLENILKIKSEKICIKKLSSKKMKEEFT